MSCCVSHDVFRDHLCAECADGEVRADDERRREVYSRRAEISVQRDDKWRWKCRGDQIAHRRNEFVDVLCDSLISASGE